MIPLTQVEGYPDRSAAKPGMAYFSNTGPFGKKCGDCIHRVRKGGACDMYRKMSGKHGPPIDKDWASCKYFEGSR